MGFLTMFRRPAIAYFIWIAISFTKPATLTGAIIQQTQSVEWLAAGQQEFMVNDLQRRFPVNLPDELQRIAVIFGNILNFDKFDPSIGILNEVRQLIQIEMQMDIILNPIGLDPLGNPYPAFGDIFTISHNRFFLDQYLSMTPPSPDLYLGGHSVDNYVYMQGLYLNTVIPSQYTTNYDKSPAKAANPISSSLPTNMHAFLKNSPGDDIYTHGLSGGFIWEIDAWFLHPGEFVPPGVEPSYPPWHWLDNRAVGFYALQMQYSVTYEYDYSPYATAVPEPASLTLVGIGAAGMVVGAMRRRKLCKSGHA